MKLQEYSGNVMGEMRLQNKNIILKRTYYSEEKTNFRTEDKVKNKM